MAAEDCLSYSVVQPDRRLKKGPKGQKGQKAIKANEGHAKVAYLNP
jgi:hypothetical protein